MKKCLFLFIFILGCTKNPQKSVLAPLKESRFTSGQCYELANKKLKNHKSIIKFAIEGKLSYSFLLFKDDNSTVFSSFPKQDLDQYTLEKTSCPEETVTLEDLHYDFLDNGKKYQGNNLDIEKVAPGQCVHLGSEVFKVTAKKDGKVALKSETSYSYESFEEESLSKLKEYAVITDCILDLKKAYAEIKASK